VIFKLKIYSLTYFFKLPCDLVIRATLLEGNPSADIERLLYKPPVVNTPYTPQRSLDIFKDDFCHVISPRYITTATKINKSLL